MTEVVIGDEKIVTDLPAEAVADLQAPKEPEKPADEPAKEPEASKEPAAPAKAEEPKTAEPAKPAEPAAPAPEAPKGKPKPIATLLQKKHDLEVENKGLKEQLEKLSQKPATAATADDVKALAEELGADPDVLQKIVDFARKGMNPTIPAELQDLVKQNQAQKEQQAEQAAFDNDFGRLVKSLPDAEIKDPRAKEKLQALAYSEELAPDGEPYFKKSLTELFYGFVKPEIEPGKPSAEASRGGSKATPKVLDFQEVFDRDDPKDIDAMDDKTFSAYSKWMEEKQGDVPIRRGK